MKKKRKEKKILPLNFLTPPTRLWVQNPRYSPVSRSNTSEGPRLRLDVWVSQWLGSPDSRCLIHLRWSWLAGGGGACWWHIHGPAGRRGGSWARPWFPCCKAEFQAVICRNGRRTLRVKFLHYSPALLCTVIYFRQEAFFKIHHQNSFHYWWAWSDLWLGRQPLLVQTLNCEASMRTSCANQWTKIWPGTMFVAKPDQSVQDEGQKDGKSLEIWNIEEPRGHNTTWEARCQKGDEIQVRSRQTNQVCGWEPSSGEFENCNEFYLFLQRFFF